jgi:hypothetical protein
VAGDFEEIISDADQPGFTFEIRLIKEIGLNQKEKSGYKQ